MVLIGYLAFLDPPKSTTEEAIRVLGEHGVAAKVLTGDNDRVTRCICRQVKFGIDRLLLGSEIEHMDDGELAAAVEKTNVFAKLSPQQKARDRRSAAPQRPHRRLPQGTASTTQPR